MKANLQKLLEIYDNEIRKKCRNQRKVYVFERNKMQNISNIYNSLLDNSYYPTKYNIFMVRDPKYRIVMSLTIRDKLVNHYVARNVLIPKLDKCLDTRVVATRTNYGVDFGVKLIKKYIERNKKYGNFYVLKLDIKKYFYNIDHEVLKSLLIDKLDEDEYLMLSRIIDSTDSKYVNDDISKMKKLLLEKGYDSRKIDDLPYYKKGKGLSLGAMTSQFLSIFYLYKLDFYIVHKLGLNCMVHYMDDIVIIHHDKEYLKKCMFIIEKKLLDEYKLEVNKKKTRIVSIHEGFNFLGYRFYVKGNKTIMKIKKDTIKRVKRRVKGLNYLYKNNYVSFEKVFCSLNTYLHSFKYVKNFKVVRIVDKNFRVN